MGDSESRRDGRLCGWAGKILDVDLTSGTTTERETLAYAGDYIGGRSLAARIAWEEISAGVDAFDPENRIIIATGPLTGTLAPTAGRTIMSGVSPRVYPRPWYTHSTLGGWFGPNLKYAGWDAVVVHGRAAAPVCLEIVNGAARLTDARDLWGQDSRQTQLALKARAGAEAQVLTIGQAGENWVRLSTVQHAEENAAGLSGFGAVWGSKNLKAIVARGTGAVRVADPVVLLAEVRQLGTNRVTPVHGSLFSAQERNTRRPVCSQSCTNNCQLNYYGLGVDGRRRAGCCVGGRLWMGNVGPRFRQTRYSGGGLEIPENINFGPETNASLHDLFNGLGIDLYMRLSMHTWLIRCHQLGVREIRGYPLDPENPVWLEGFVNQLARRQGLGAIFADDLRRAVDELAGELPSELISLGEHLEFAFGFPAHREGRVWDGEPLPFWVISALMYASESRDPTIGSHMSNLLLAEFVLKDRELAQKHFRRLAQKVWGDPEALEPRFGGKAPITIWIQHQHMLLDTLPLCDFSFPKLVRPLADENEWRAAEDIGGDLDLDLRLLTAVTGVKYSREDLTGVAERACTLERAMLARFGRTRSMEEALAPHFALPCKSDGTSIDLPAFSRLLDEYYTARGWDRELGWPTAGLLRRLGLEEVIEPLERYEATTRLSRVE